MPSSRTQDPTADLFGAAGVQPCSAPAQTSAKPATAVVSIANKSSPRYVLPTALSSALQQLDDEELDRLLGAAQHELKRRGRPTTGAGAPDLSNAVEDSERRRSDGLGVALTQGQVNAVRATFKAGITPSRIARQFGISQSDVRKVLASEPRRFGEVR
jgi:hypothetical protein